MSNSAISIFLLCRYNRPVPTFSLHILTRKWRLCRFYVCRYFRYVDMFIRSRYLFSHVFMVTYVETVNCREVWTNSEILLHVPAIRCELAVNVDWCLRKPRMAMFIPIKSLARLIWHNLLNECQRWVNNSMCLYCPRKVDQYKPNMESPDARWSKRSNIRAFFERPIRAMVQTIII